ncbi:MAG: hypothetical protein PHC64_10860 [Candidatus Gastranaerophilales bacterium]|nr:hypothetical protein [Candidatus Gastranaerophilales bacterium]
MINYYQIKRVQLIHQNGDTHYLTFATDERVKDLEKYRECLMKKYHCQKVNLSYSEII